MEKRILFEMRGKGYDGSILSDIEAVYNFLNSCPEKIGAKQLFSPHAFHHNSGTFPEMNGLSGFVLFVSNGYCYIHTFPKKQCINIGIYSSDILDFDVKSLVKFVKGRFKMRRWRIKLAKLD